MTALETRAAGPRTAEFRTTGPRTTTRPAGRAAPDGFDRRLFVDTIAIVAMVALPVVLVLAGLLDLPYLLIAVALVVPALAAVPVALEQRHRVGVRPR